MKDGICTLYSLPFRTNYGTNVQTVTKVTELGNGTKFNFLTAGDITPDGHWMAIKSKKFVLLWERNGTESLSETVKRTPVQIAAYSEETQGESLAWLDATTFYTTSDAKNDDKIYKYVRSIPTAVEQTPSTEKKVKKVMVNGQVLISRDGTYYDLLGGKHDRHHL